MSDYKDRDGYKDGHFYIIEYYGDIYYGKYCRETRMLLDEVDNQYIAVNTKDGIIVSHTVKCLPFIQNFNINKITEVNEMNIDEFQMWARTHPEYFI